MISALKPLKNFVKTMTYDNGKEFVEHEAKIESYTSKDYPTPSKNYREDKAVFISFKNKLRLRKGVKARESIARIEKQQRSAQVMGNEVEKPISEGEQPKLSGSPEESITDDVVKDARFKPMPNQKVSSKNDQEWQRRAEKHYLPCIGYDKDQRKNQEKFVMFGLNLRKMRNNWQEINNPYHPRHYYRKFSTDQNCCGICLSLLLKGGSSHFNPNVPKFVTTQTNFQRYSAELLEKLDSLNSQSDFLNQKVKLYELNDVPPMRLTTICDQLASFPGRYSIPSEWKKSFSGLISATKALESSELSVDDLIPIAEQMVTQLVNLFQYTNLNNLIQDDVAIPALHAYKLLQERMQEAYENENPNEHYDIN